MARKLFLSFLGTGLYRKCTYFDEKGEYGETRYIQEATLRQIGATEWEKPNAIRIFITEKAFEDNWDKRKTTRKDTIKKEIIPYIRLEQKIEDLHLKADFKAVTNMPVGNGDSEMWQIFQTVFDEIEEGDELYIDLTHAFRYQPMLLLVLSNYSKFLKHTTVKHISYGNFEAKDDYKDRGEGNYAPIVDLMPLISLQDWTSAAADFLNNGYSGGLEKLAQSFRGADKTGITEFVQVIKKFTLDRQTCRGVSITGNNIEKELREITLSTTDANIPPLNPILRAIHKELTPPIGTMDKVISAAEWCLHNREWQQSLSILQEGIVTFFCERHGLDAMDKNRNLINSAFTISKNMRKARKDRIRWKVLPENLSKVLELLEDPLIANKDISRLFCDITTLRNNYMHAGYGHIDAQNPYPDISSTDIQDVIERTKTTLVPKCAEEFKAQPYEYTKKVFINISNHPSSEWTEEQFSKAKNEYGEITDIPFPDIQPTSDSKKINDTAKKIAREIFQKFDDTTDITVHVMGEMTFTTNLVGILKGCGIRCVASCTKRDVEELGDGKKLATFKFVQFREY